MSDSGVSGTASSVRKPRARVTANGIELRYVSVQVIKNANHESDTFQISLPLFDPQAQLDWTWWADQTDIEIEIQVGFADENGELGKMTQLMIGPVDAVALQPLAYGHPGTRNKGFAAAVGFGGIPTHESAPAHPEGALLTIRGGDYSRQMINSTMSKQFTENAVTTKDVVQNIVANHPQLTLDMSQADDQVGDEYDNVEGRLFLHRSEWDVITGLADHLGMRAYMDGKTVKIAPPPAPDASNPFVVFYYRQSEGSPVQANCETLKMSRALNVAKGVDVFVESYDYQTGKPPSRRKASARRSKNASKSNPLTYNFSHPGMNDSQAQKSAKSRADQISKFEREIEVQMPGDPSLTIERMVKLAGTGTAFDQTYYPDQITHWIDVRRGYLMEFRARNRSQDVEITENAVTDDSSSANTSSSSF